MLQWFVVAFEWTWDSDNKSAASEVSPDEREVRFHINYSSGTAAVRGTCIMSDRQYFWEVKMTTPVYGTDMVTTGFLNLLTNTGNIPGWTIARLSFPHDAPWGRWGPHA